jgi:hypothetical protein
VIRPAWSKAPVRGGTGPVVPVGLLPKQAIDLQLSDLRLAEIAQCADKLNVSKPVNAVPLGVLLALLIQSRQLAPVLVILLLIELVVTATCPESAGCERPVVVSDVQAQWHHAEMN